MGKRPWIRCLPHPIAIPPSEELKEACLPIAYQYSLLIAAQSPLGKGPVWGVRTLYHPMMTIKVKVLGHLFQKHLEALSFTT